MSASTIERGYVDAPSGQVHYRVHGQGPSLVFFHQTATSGRVFEPTMRLLADSFRCIALDTPGFGGSDAPPTPYLMPEYAAALGAALSNLGVDSFHLLGHHTGASVAAELAAQAPERINKLILHSCPEVSEEVREEKIKESVPLVIDHSGAHVEWVTNRLRGYSTKLGPEDLHYFIWEYLHAAPRYHEAHVAVWAYHVRERLDRLTMPVLFLSGEHDQFVKEHEELAALLPNARTHVAAGRGRLNMVENPAEYAATIRSFLAG